MAFKCLDRIRRTRRKIATRRRQQRRNGELVESYERHKHRTHDYLACRSTAVMLSFSSPARLSNDAVYAFRCALTTASTGARVPSSWVRTISRSRRLSRFRSTALCPYFGTRKPTRGWRRGEARTRTSRCLVRTRFPFRPTSWMSEPFVSRWLRGKVSPLRGSVLRWQLYRETPTSLLASPTQYFAAPFGFHPRPEAVGSDPSLVAGAICWLTH